MRVYRVEVKIIFCFFAEGGEGGHLLLIQPPSLNFYTLIFKLSTIRLRIFSGKRRNFLI